MLCKLSVYRATSRMYIGLAQINQPPNNDKEPELTIKPTPAKILAALDEACLNGRVPALDNLNVRYIGLRMTAYSDGSRWAVIFNSIAWADGRIQAIVGPVGNCLAVTEGKALAERAMANSPQMQALAGSYERAAKGGFFSALFTAFRGQRKMMDAQREMMASYQQVMSTAAAQGELTDNDLFIDTGEVTVDFDESDPGAPAKVTAASVRGREVPLAELDIQPRLDLYDDPGFWVAVALAGKYRASLFAQPDEIAAFFPDGLPPRLLEVEEWRHVDVTRDEMPSAAPAFRMIAHAIAAADASLYRPAEKPNTDWSLWIDRL